jgi:CDGSH-type Zn-finger protein
MDDVTKRAADAATRSPKEADPPDRAEGEAFVAYMREPAPQDTPRGSAKEGLTGSARALDRWFTERQKNQGAPRLLEIPNEAMISNGGPLQVTGNITLVREDGSVMYANHLTLCRCGASQAKPNCDGQHQEREFLHAGKMTEVSELPASPRAGKITISCIKDGPITFRGRLRLHNEFGQECVKMRGSLCRCGQSTNKPFCDGSHQRVGFKSGCG